MWRYRIDDTQKRTYKKLSYNAKCQDENEAFAQRGSTRTDHP